MDDRQQIALLYDEMYIAMISKDRRTLEAIHADGFVLTHMTGLRQDKRTYLDSIARGTLNYYSAVTEGLDISIHGDRARMVGKSRVEAAVFGGGQRTWPLQLAFDLTRAADGWKLVSAQASMY